MMRALKNAKKSNLFYGASKNIDLAQNIFSGTLTNSKYQMFSFMHLDVIFRTVGVGLVTKHIYDFVRAP